MPDETRCSNCDLALGCKTVCMQPDVSELRDGRCDVMIVGEAPGHDEDLVGKPFVGASGSLLRAIVEDVGLDEFGIVYTNVVRCRPPDNATPSVRQIKTCAQKLLDEIQHYSPSLVILMGNTPLKAVMGESGITNWRGAKLERDGRTFIPTFHPAYILRNNSELGTLVKDMQLAYDVLAGTSNQPVVNDYTVELVVGAQDAEEMYKHIKEARVVAFDTESRNAKPYNADVPMIMLSFAVNKPTKRAWAILPDNERVVELCKSILADPSISKIGHNMKYDQHVVWRAWGVKVNGIVGDSMLASWMHDPTPGRHGLKHLAGRLLGMYAYNAELDAYHAQHPESNPAKRNAAGVYGDQCLVPLDVLAPYGAIDAIATLEIHRILYKKLSPTQRVLYNELIIPASSVLQHMEQNGVEVDPYIIKRYITVYSYIQAQKLEEMLADPILIKFAKMMQARLDAVYDSKYKGKSTKAKRPVFTFNPNSDLQMRELLYGKKFFNLKPLGETEKGEPSTSWEHLKSYAADYPFLKSYRYYSMLGKMLSTYLNPALPRRGEDGKTRSSYNIHGTVSGRLSSSDPNLQNIPTPEKEPGTVLAYLPVKNIFTASDWASAYPDEWEAWKSSQSPEELKRWQDLLGPYFDKGGLVLAADYSGMELRTMASVSGCKHMSEIFARGDDVHRIVSAGIFNVPVSEVTKDMRYKGKWTNWTLLYGGSEYTFKRLYGIPLDEGKRFVKTYYDLFPEIRTYQEETKQFARDNGYVESMFGQRRYLPFINDMNGSKRSAAEREAVNHPIQSVASQMLLMALIILDDVMDMNQICTLMVNTVHDSIMFDTPLWELDVVSRLIKRIMEHLTDQDLYKTWFPGMDLSWFTCPLVVDIEVGSHYGCLTEYHVKDDESK